MFKKVLIANRGAIATRIIRTLKRLNIQSVAIYAECDRESLHVRHADEAYNLSNDSDNLPQSSGSVASRTYLDGAKIIAIAKRCGAEAIHPGYGFLSENSDFARQCERENLVFIGPTADHIELFGLKHHARQLAQDSDVPLLAGSPLLETVDEALSYAQDLGYPVMLKSTAGGGGIGLLCCYSADKIRSTFESIRRQGLNSFANAGVFVEKFIQNARHIEVQVIGDGAGKALAIGERDCSSQRRNQKVIEECPAPGLDADTCENLHRTAERILASSHYKNIGTVEFILDVDTNAFYFLEVNTRLQVEHGVTEAVYGLDLVELMLQEASNDGLNLEQYRATLTPSGHAIQARLYAEDPYLNFQPCAGLLGHVEFPQAAGLRIDHWIEGGIQVPDCFDPMLGKVIVHADTRNQALQKLSQSLRDTRIYGIETNRDYLLALSRDPTLLAGQVTTRYLNEFTWAPANIYVQSAGTQTTVQAYPGRTGYWHVGVPPSGPFDSYSFRLGNRLLGNAATAAGLEITLTGPTLRFASDTQVVITGAPVDVSLDDQPVDLWQLANVKAGQTLRIGSIGISGARAYLCILGGLNCPDYLGSAATFTLGQFGGHNGRALKTGDVLKTEKDLAPVHAQQLCHSLRPVISNHWQVRVIYGPHGANDFFTKDDIDNFFSTHWKVHYNSSRTGIRLIGPKPQWARKDGGEAGLHPSNIHDNAYAFGSVDFTGDMPVILGPDGPSLGGFVCPATIIQADLWKVGQLRADDTIQFLAVDYQNALTLEDNQKRQIETLQLTGDTATTIEPLSPIIDTIKTADNTSVVYRYAGDHFLLVEYGEPVLDIELRFRAHALMQYLESNPLEGVLELTPGIRSLQVHYNSQIVAVRALTDYLIHAEKYLSQQLHTMTVPSRIVRLPLSWDDEACQQAIDKYSQSVRPDAPWCPSNLEFIRRINGLSSIDDVKKIVFDASYLVMGLGDVYLGAPVATPVNAAHRLVTTKYNPARTWTAENSVGIGGSYLCVYGMEGPGGYQFVGRTLQMWNRYRQTKEFTQPWLLRFFDQIQFYEVSHQELMEIRQAFPLGNYPLDIQSVEFSLQDYKEQQISGQSTAQEFQKIRSEAFSEELAMWHATDQFNFDTDDAPPTDPTANGNEQWPEGSTLIESPVAGSVWKIEIESGAEVQTGDTLAIIESMKMEVPITAPTTGRIAELLCSSGQRVQAGQALILIEERDNKKSALS